MTICIFALVRDDPKTRERFAADSTKNNIIRISTKTNADFFCFVPVLAYHF